MDAEHADRVIDVDFTGIAVTCGVRDGVVFDQHQDREVGDPDRVTIAASR
ncbi:hypothetical protein [Nocardia sp. NPDC057440]